MSLNELPPLVFRPVIKQIRWGGRKLGSMLGKAIGDDSDYAESWEIADHADGMSLVADGPLSGMTLAELIKTAPVSLFGKYASFTQFPLLIKFLDANDWLSLQVHPDDAKAKRYNPVENGKTEAWVILHAEPSSQICAGLKPEVTPEQLRAAIATGQTEDLLNIYNVKAGDCIFVPAGTVHALGPGIVLAEVQQQSNLTFRLHDWGRVDVNGKSRPVHLEESMACTDFGRGPVRPVVARKVTEGDNIAEELVRCPYFVIRRHTASKEVSLADREEFRILMILEGTGRLETSRGSRTCEKGTTILIPACCRSLQIVPETNLTFLEVLGPGHVS